MANVERVAGNAAKESPTGLTAQYRQMASDSEREREAEEWMEGLLDDASGNCRFAAEN
jgi:hypothetical protein